LPEAFPCQARLSRGKWRASHSDLDSSHTSHDGLAPPGAEAALLVSGKFVAGSELELASDPDPRHHDNRLGAAASTPSEPVGPGEDKLKFFEKPAQPENPGSDTSSDSKTSPTSGGRLMAFPPASTSFVLPLDFTESESLRIRLRSRIHRLGSRLDPDDSTNRSITSPTQFLSSKTTF